MKPQPEPSTGEVLAGLIERVTYHNPENGFCVLRAKARGHRDLVTLVGHAATHRARRVELPRADGPTIALTASNLKRSFYAPRFPIRRMALRNISRPA